ncbi:MAG: hypothetical protein K8U03_09170 [Planctomycetia bacterium]|nr:hypothetical protein [Planctomycetia bacterium]
MIDCSRSITIAENEHWWFNVGPITGTEPPRWVGYALGKQRVEGSLALMLFPEVSDGCELGLLNKWRAVLLTGAIAQDPASCYGGVANWFVDEQDRGSPEDFRCQRCGDVGCTGDCREDVYLDHEE